MWWIHKYLMSMAIANELCVYYILYSNQYLRQSRVDLVYWLEYRM